MSRHADLEASIHRPTLFVGREAELDRLAGASARVPVVLICGVAGVGKSALASAFAATWSGPVVSSALAGDSLAELVDDARRALGASAADLGSVADRLSGLARRLDQAGGLWLIDDLHRLAPDDRRLAFRVMGHTLRRGRVLVTSRERVGVDAGGPDHAELRLGGLADADARRLWQLLDGLYGPSDGFEAAMARAGGNPFLLRRGHAGDLSDEDPLGDSVGGLSRAERRVAGALALAGIRLPFELVARLVGPDEVRDAVRRLVDRMIVEAHPDGELSMHDLVRDAMLRSMQADEVAALHGDLALQLPDSSLDPARRARAVCRHLRALDLHEEAARYLIERGSELDKFGAAGELLRGLAAIPKDRRSPEASAALARVSARAFDLGRAYAEHERLLGADVGPPVELALVHALLALLTGRPAVADASLDRIVRAGELPPAIHIRALTTQATVRAYSGEPGEAAQILLAAIPRATGPATEAPLWLYLAYVLSTEERDAEASEAIRRALILRGENALSYRSSVLTSTVAAAIAAALGQFAEAEAALEDARQLMAGDEDVLLTTYVRHIQATLLVERGDWLDALEALRTQVERFREGGHVLGELAGSALQGRVLLLMGRRAEGLELLAGCRAAATQRGLRGVERAVDRALACDPARLLGGSAAPEAGAAAQTGRPASRVWHRLAAAIRLAAEGEARRASALVAAELSVPVRPGHELGRVLAAVVDAVIAMAAGESAAVATHLAAARAAAGEAGIDQELVTSLLAALGPLRVVSAGRSRITTAADLTVGPDDRVVDARSHELRFDGQTVALLRRPMLRRLLYGLVRRRGVVVSKDELAAALWTRAYNPLTDHGPLKSNIANLRKLIEQAGMSIDFDEDGYRLVGADRLVYIEPISWPAV